MHDQRILSSSAWLFLLILFLQTFINFNPPFHWATTTYLTPWLSNHVKRSSSKLRSILLQPQWIKLSINLGIFLFISTWLPGNLFWTHSTIPWTLLMFKKSKIQTHNHASCQSKSKHHHIKIPCKKCGTKSNWACIDMLKTKTQAHT